MTRFLFLPILICIPLRAETLSLPLQGYFHPGRAMPIEWNNLAPGESIQLSAKGAITSRVQDATITHGVFPWLVIDQYPTDPSKPLPPLHPLNDSDLLIASTLEDDAPASALFPNHTTTILLHPTSFLEGPEMAWETLDAILFTPESLAKTPASTRTNLFAAGVELAALSKAKPDEILPWHRQGQWWIASSNLQLPPPTDAAAFAPIAGWTAGRSADFRRHIFLLGVIYSLAIAGIALWRSQSMPTAIVVVSIVAFAVLWLDNNTTSPIYRCDRIVQLIDKTTIDDHWTYQLSHRSADFMVGFDPSIHPVFADASDLLTMNLIIDFDQNARPLGISGRLIADEPFALMTRRLAAPTIPTPLTNPTTTPMHLLAADPIYRDFKIQGELTNPTPDESWPGIVLQRR